MLLAPLARLAPRVAAAAGRSISTAAPAAKAAPFAAKAVGWTAVGVVGAAVADKMRSEEVTEGSTSLTSSVVSAVSSLLSRSPVLLDTAGPNPGGVTFDSYMIPDADLEEGQLRLLEVDARVILPVETHVRFVISSTDVIHDWAVPSLGIKLDAIPGRLNQTSTLIERKGVFYGQCSELCGVYHGFMPIVVEAVDVPEYLAWILAEAA